MRACPKRRVYRTLLARAHEHSRVTCGEVGPVLSVLPLSFRSSCSKEFEGSSPSSPTVGARKIVVQKSSDRRIKEDGVFLDSAVVGSSVLVVGDVADLRRIIETALKHAGYDVQTAEKGERALELCKQRDPDVILVDIDTPVVSGRAFVIAYRALPTANARIVVMSANAAESEARTMACEFGLSKPFSMDEVIAAVRYLSSSTPINVSL